MKKPPPPSMSLAEAMAALEAAGTEQTRKTWRRHGITGPIFGVSFATLQVLRKQIKVNHALASGLWASGNYDARNLAVKVADPLALSSDDLDRWARDTGETHACAPYVAMLAAEGPHGIGRAEAWLRAASATERNVGWALVGQLAQTELRLADAWFETRLDEIVAGIHAGPDSLSDSMLRALIAIGCRNPQLRARALEAWGRVGPIHIGYGDTECQMPNPPRQLEKAWAHSLSKGFESPAAHERSRQKLRLRC